MLHAKRVRCQHYCLLDHLATLTQNTIQPRGDLPAFDRLTVPTDLQRKAFDLPETPIPT